MSEYKKLLGFFMLCLFQVTYAQPKLTTGAEQVNEYLPLLKAKKIGLVVNQTSTIGQTHLVDSLQKLPVSIKAIFAPEHGFRGNHGAGVHIKNNKDAKTGLKVISLYGTHKKPTKDDLKDIQIVVFDIQDVGARFYTYISTLHYVMEACAEQKKQLVILDRPNPNGFYVDGPVLDKKFQSFVGMHPVPVVHGMTIGEYAQMINGEKWLKDGMTCNIKIIKMKGYTHNDRYSLPVKPSPNLPTAESIALYPSMCFFEGTNYSLGRGTDKPFECFGKPENTKGDYTFTPKAIAGVAENPPYKDKLCRGRLVTNFVNNIFNKEPRLYLDWIMNAYQEDTSKATFFTDFFTTLAGTDELKKQIIAGKTEAEIRASWQPKLNEFRVTRKKYLLYTDFVYFYK
ncbi:hypothetical protein AEM51_02895 [Bacteroidetes bacterium UKL13-3]|jgi:uncharacterized protein YbbC (DUF1343 family)|nr:hypothetical protein AEM51_02895 [Bacteroidetes bacterium UKL13-3]